MPGEGLGAAMSKTCHNCGQKMPFVYFMYRTGLSRTDPERLWGSCPRLIKIGKSVEPEKRIGQVGDDCGWWEHDGERSVWRRPQIDLLAVTPGGHDLEVRLHRVFASCRVSGEWFYPTRSLVEFVRSIGSYGRFGVRL